MSRARLERFGFATALALGALAAGACDARRQAAAGQPGAQAGAGDVQILVNHFVPRAALTDFTRLRWEENYRAALIANDMALEQRYPGIHAAMTSATLEEMQRSLASHLDRAAGLFEAELRANLSADDISALARLLGHPAARAVTGTRLLPREGESSAQMLERSRRETESAARTSRDVADFERQAQAFAATPQGRRLLPTLGNHQATAQRLLTQILGRARIRWVRAGQLAANAFVRRSHPADAPPFPDVPPL